VRNAVVATLLTPLILWADPPRSGLDAGQRPGPYSSLVVVGAERGTQHCFVCEADKNPVAIVFARTPSEPLGKFVRKLDGMVKKSPQLKTWTTFLADDAGAIEPKILAWSKDHATGSVPITIFEDAVGPPSYRLSSEADITVVLAVGRKTVVGYSYRVGELGDAAIDAMMENAAKLVAK
jgi:hypothetical protein